MIKLIQYLLLVIIILGCSSKKDESSTLKYSYVETHRLLPLGDKVIKLDSLTDPWKIHYFMFNQNYRKQLFILSSLDNSLQVYDWEKGTLLSKKILPKEGPDGVGVASSIFVKNIDSIFVLSSYQFQLSLINADYKVVKRYSLLHSSNGKPKIGEGMFPIGKQTSSMGFYNNKIIVGGYPFIDRTEESFYSKGKTSLSLDIKSGVFEYLTSVPNSYKVRYENGNKILAQQIFSSQTFNYEKGQMILSHLTEPFVEVVNLNSKKVIDFYAGGESISEILWAKRNMENQDEFKFFLKQPYFSSIYYDKYRKVYYRILELPNLEKKDNYDEQPWTKPSVIILNDEFKKIGETILPKGYSLSSLIITENGAYFRKYIDSEDTILFTLFKLIEK
jgi:hypothetical protein